MNDKQLFILKDRFAEDNKFPITVFEPGIWEYYLDLYEPVMKTKTKWNEFLRIIDTEFGGEPERYLHEYRVAMKEVMIGAIKAVPEYENKFNNSGDRLTEFEVFPEFLRGIREGDIYNEGFVGETYLSVDLSSANLQALYHITPDFFPGQGKISWDNNPKNIYKGWLRDTLKGIFPEKAIEYISDLKYTRQVIFGNCNPKRQTKIEKFLVGQAAQAFYEIGGLNPVMHGWDEVIFRVEQNYPKDTDLLRIAKEMADTKEIFVKPEIYKLSSIEYRTHNDVSIRVYKKEYENGEIKYKGINKLYHAQIYEDLYGIEQDSLDRDLMFYHQTNDLSKFIYRIKRI